MSTMIKCVTCKTNFARPKGRGRPPVKCAGCRSPQTASKASTSVVEVSASPKPPQALSVSQKAVKPYRSGFCGFTMRSDGVAVTHSPEIHQLCGVSICTCDCHGSK